MKELDELRSILISLSIGEKRDIYNRLKGNEIGQVKNTSLRLIDLIFKKNDIGFDELQISLYGKKNVLAIKKLISRIIDKVFDIIIYKENILVNNIYDKRAQDIFLLERQMLISEILRFRGLFNLSKQKLDKVISQCKFYEHYDILLYSLEKRKHWIVTGHSNKEYKGIDEEIKYYSNVKNSLRISNEIYLRIIKINIELFNDYYHKYLISSIQKLNKILKEFKSNQIKYNSIYIKAHLYYLKFDYKSSLDQINELLEFIKLNENVYTKQREGNALLNKGILYRNNFNFELSIKNIIESKKYLSDQKQNNIIYYEQLLLTYFYDGNMPKVKYYLTIIDREILFENYLNVDLNKIYFYKAVLSLIEGNYNLSNQCLQQIKSSVSVLLNFEYRIIAIINYINLNKLDLADNCIESLRKFDSRNNSGKHIYIHKKLIIKILIKLSKLSYDFKSTFKIHQSIILKLKNNYSQFKFYNSEMLIFHEWFDSKVNNVPYNHMEVMKRLKKMNKARD